MADLSITAANVFSGTGANISFGTAGDVLTAGRAVYLDVTTNTWKLADNNSATVAARTAGGIALTGSAIGQPVAVQLPGGEITIGATLTQGVAYYLSATAGGICPVADLSTGMQSQVIGIAKSTTVLALSFATAGVTL